MLELKIGMQVEWRAEHCDHMHTHSGRIIAFDETTAVVREHGHANTVFVDRKDLLLPDGKPEE